MLEWWNSLGLAVQIFYCIAIPSTLLLLIQTIMMFLGFDDDGEAEAGVESTLGESDGDISPELDTDADANVDVSGLDGLRIFTVRGLIGFFVVFGWLGIVLLGAGVGLVLTVIISSVCGFLMMLLLAYLFKAMLKLRSDGNIDNRNAIGTSGKVHLTIPANRSGEGKVHLLLQGTYVERSAVTDSDEAIPTGAEVVVVGLSGQTDLVVRKK